MNANGARRIAGALLAFAFAFAGGAANASGQAPTIAPGQAAALKVAVGSGPRRGRRPDSMIVTDVRRAFRRVPQLDASRIRVHSHFGSVTLNGTVPETWMISRAGRAARQVHGVTGVQNRLTARR